MKDDHHRIVDASIRKNGGWLSDRLWRFSVVILLSIGMFAQTSSTPYATRKVLPMSNPLLNDEVESMTAFAKTNDPSDLRKSVDDLKAFCLDEPTNASGVTDDAVANLWLRHFAVVDPIMDRLKASLKMADTKVQPPPNDLGSISPDMAGVSPSEISDKSLRKQYEASIAENHKRIEASNRYNQFRVIEEQANAYFFVWCAPRYRGKPAEAKRVIADALALNLSAARMRAISAAVGIAVPVPS